MFFLRTFCSPMLRNSLNGRQHFSSLKEDSALELLKKYDSPVMEYYTIRKAEEAKIAATKIIDNPSNISGGGVIKALVASGGRALGKFKDGGCDSGIKMFKTAEEAEEIAQKMLGYRLVTKQTGPEGLLCEKLMLVPEIKHSKTIYAAFSIDRTSETGITLIGSAEGGINIEDTAKHNPGAIIKLPVNASGDDLDEKCGIFIERLTFLPNKSKQELSVALKKLFQAFKQSDCTLAEVNPIFLEDGSGRIIFGDSKVAVDSNAMFRQDFVQKLLDESSTEGKKEQKESFNYVKLDGNIGCLGNNSR
ncbi:MAG: succinate--CoA ligase beta chain [Marteilia pararefringens]